jgi:hypothetical protein
MLGAMEQAKLKSLLDYDPDTGQFTWTVSKPPRAVKGSIAGYNNGSGYIKISVDGTRYYAHRLAFVWMTGSTPNTIDHINGIKHDNRWSNLRDVMQKTNSRNRARSSGVRRRYGKWYARYADVHLGVFETKEAAVAAYIEARNNAAGLDPDMVRQTEDIPNAVQKRWSYNRTTYKGKSLSQWAKELGVPQPTLHHKVHVQGIPLVDIIKSRV